MLVQCFVSVQSLTAWAALGATLTACAALHRTHGGSYELWPRQSALEQNQNFMGLPLNFDNPPAACGPGNACMARPLYPHAFLLPTGEYFLCWIKCAPITRPFGEGDGS